MAIEIRELIIRTNIVDDSRVTQQRARPEDVYPDEKRIVDRCVERVLRKMSKKKER